MTTPIMIPIFVGSEVTSWVTAPLGPELNNEELKSIVKYPMANRRTNENVKRDFLPTLFPNIGLNM